MTAYDTYDTYGYDTSGYLKFILWSSVLRILIINTLRMKQIIIHDLCVKFVYKNLMNIKTADLSRGYNPRCLKLMVVVIGIWIISKSESAVQ